jgi:hypothetical protein
MLLIECLLYNYLKYISKIAFCLLRPYKVGYYLVKKVVYINANKGYI